MEDKYTLEWLSKNFSEHAKFFDEQCKKELEDYKKNYPDSELPEHLKEGFNLPRALAVICFEIQIMKQRL